MYFGVFIVIKGYRNSTEKAVSYFIINMGGIIVRYVKQATFETKIHFRDSLAIVLCSKSRHRKRTNAVGL